MQHLQREIDKIKARCVRCGPAPPPCMALPSRLRRAAGPSVAARRLGRRPALLAWADGATPAAAGRPSGRGKGYRVLPSPQSPWTASPPCCPPAGQGEGDGGTVGGAGLNPGQVRAAGMRMPLCWPACRLAPALCRAAQLAWLPSRPRTAPSCACQQACPAPEGSSFMPRWGLV